MSNFEQFSKYGITFERLNKNHLDMVREWRNSEDVRVYMQYQKIITKEEHYKWFKSINNNTNFYYVAYHKEDPFGVYNIKDIDYNLKQGETGVFVKSKNYWEGDISMRGTFLLLEIFFKELGLNKSLAQVLKTNIRVLNYNKQLGFKITDNNSIISENLILTKEDFYSKRNQRLISYMKKNG